MVKRIHHVLAILITFSMLVVPLVSASTSPEPAVGGAETANSQPLVSDSPEVGEPNPHTTLAQPNGEGPVLQADAGEVQSAGSAPQMSIEQPTDQEILPAVETPAVVPFDLISVIRSCDDQTRFDLEWMGTGQIASIDYVLFNSSDNSSMPGAIPADALVETNATVWGKPGDTAMRLNVLMVDGEQFEYLSDASECGTSRIRLGQADATSETVVAATPASEVMTRNASIVAPSNTTPSLQSGTLAISVTATSGWYMPGLQIQVRDQLRPYKTIRSLEFRSVGTQLLNLEPGAYRITNIREYYYDTRFYDGFQPLDMLVWVYPGETNEVDLNVKPTTNLSLTFIDQVGELHAPEFRIVSASDESDFVEGGSWNSDIIKLLPGRYRVVVFASATNDRTEVDVVVGEGWVDLQIEVTGFAPGYLYVNTNATIASWVPGVIVDLNGEVVLDVNVAVGPHSGNQQYFRLRTGQTYVLHLGQGFYYQGMPENRGGIQFSMDDHPWGTTPLTVGLAPVPHVEMTFTFETYDGLTPQEYGIEEWGIVRAYSVEESGDFDIVPLGVGRGNVVVTAPPSTATWFEVWVPGYVSIRFLMAEDWESQNTHFMLYPDEAEVGHLEIKVVPMDDSAPTDHEFCIDNVEHSPYYEGSYCGIPSDDGTVVFDKVFPGLYKVSISHPVYQFELSSESYVRLGSYHRFDKNWYVQVNGPSTTYVTAYVAPDVSGKIEFRPTFGPGMEGVVGLLYIYDYITGNQIYRIEVRDNSPVRLVLAPGTYGYDYLCPFYCNEGGNETFEVGIFDTQSFDIEFVRFDMGLAVLNVSLPTSGPGLDIQITNQSGEHVALVSAQESAAYKIDLPEGTYFYQYEGEYSARGPISFQVRREQTTHLYLQPSLTKLFTAPASGQAGTVTIVTGSGFTPDETVTLHWGDIAGPFLGSFTAAPDGTIIGSVTVPAVANLGKFEIHVVGSNGSARVSYQVTALAVVKVTLSSTSGRAGTVTTVSGTGFRPGETVTIRFGTTTGPVLATATATTTGTVSAKVTIPAYADKKAYAIIATGTSLQTGRATFTVTAWVVPVVKLAIVSGRAGTVTTVTGTGFRPGETVTIRFSTTTGPVLATTTATTTGTISARVTIPAYADTKAYAIIATGTSLQTGRATYTVTAWAIPTVKLAVVSGRAGTVTTVSGTGFRPGETVTIRFSTTTGVVLATVKASTTGAIAAKVTIPAYADKKAYAIFATGTSLQTGRATFTVTAWVVPVVKLSLLSGRAGTVTTVSGTGFRPGETVTIRFSTTTGPVLATTTATTTGTISARVTIPAYADKKAYAIFATGTSLQTGRATYTVTAWAIPTVKLSLVSGRAGTVTTVSGTGFRPGETVTVRFSTTTGVVLATVKASTTGTISARVTIPAYADKKAYAIFATGTSLQTGRATYTVTAWAIPTVKLAVVSGRAGTITTVSGTGFRPGEVVTIRFSTTTGTVLATTRATTTGTIAVKVTVPTWAQLKAYAIIATGTSLQTGRATFTVTALASSTNTVAWYRPDTTQQPTDWT